VRDSRLASGRSGRLLWQRMRGTPSIFDVLMRSGTLGSEAQRRLVREQADFIYEPPLTNLHPLDWRSFDRAVAEGLCPHLRDDREARHPAHRGLERRPAVAIPPGDQILLSIIGLGGGRPHQKVARDRPCR